MSPKGRASSMRLVRAMTEEEDVPRMFAFRDLGELATIGRLRAVADFRSLRLSGLADAARLNVTVRATRLRGRDRPRVSTIVNESRRRR